MASKRKSDYADLGRDYLKATVDVTKLSIASNVLVGAIKNIKV